MLRLWKGIPITLLLALVAPQFLSAEDTKTYIFQGSNSLRISIETHKTTEDGWTPVVLFLKDLEIALWMDANGRAFERPQNKVRGPRPLFIIDPVENALALKDRTFPLLIRSRNEIRTRMQLLEEALPMTLEIDPQKKRATFYLDKIPLDLDHIRAEFIDIGRGTHELRFTGPHLHTTEKFVYLESTETIYTTDERKGTADTSGYRIWLKKVR
jgi:hypothetical protein